MNTLASRTALQKGMRLRKDLPAERLYKIWERISPCANDMFFSKNTQPITRIAVFLGNPGERYENTRHNAGFMTAGVIEKAAGIKISRLKFNALTAAAVLGGERVFLMKPQTYMNLSGTPLRQAMSFYKIPLERVIVVSDDVSLPTGKLRIRRGGSAGGHNGLKDIIEKCGGGDFPRIKIGVGAPPHSEYDMADWVLSKFTDEDAEKITEAVKRASDALEMIIASGIDSAMGKYNAKQE